MGRRTNLALLALLVVALVTGTAAFLLGGPRTGWIVVTHGVAGLAIVFLAPWKSLVVRRGLRRGRAGRSASLVLAALALLTVIVGFLHSAGLWEARGPWSPMTIHVAAALALAPLAVWHVRRRPQKLRRTDLSRRTALTGVALLVGAVALRQATRADLRFTGSYEEGSFDPSAMPVVQWFDDRPPTIDAGGWMLRVDGRAWRYDELAPLAEDLVATLDCTGGWYSTQRWRGVRLDRLLDADAGGRSIVVTGATGYGRRFPRSDAGRLLLATHLGDRPLSRGHGFPARLVAPGRRGLWWVKWVTSIETSDRPWWLQSPVPLT